MLSAAAATTASAASRSSTVCLFGNILPGGKNYMQEKIDLKKRQTAQENKPSQSVPQPSVACVNTVMGVVVVEKTTYTVSLRGAKGKEEVLQVPSDRYILDIADEKGIDLPFSCRSGICGACVGRVVDGAVDMSDIEDVSYTLEDDQVDQGMALLCMSRPASDCVIETQCDWGYLLGMEEWKGATGNINEAVADEWTSISETK